VGDHKRAKKCDFEIALLLHICPFQKSNCAMALFKVQKSVISKFKLFCIFLHICSFQKSDCAIAHFFALFQRATKSAIAHF